MTGFVASVLLHLGALYWPRIDVGSAPEGSDKLTHVVLFAVPVVAAALALRRPWVVIALLAVHAPVSEWLQSAVLSDRVGDLRDAAADLVGVVLGAAAGLVLRRRGGHPTLVE
jgi:hypothetical protein